MRTVLSFSGGMDSTVLLYHLKYELDHEVIALGVYYGQRHEREIAAARAICLTTGTEYILADLGACSELFKGSSQTSAEIDVPEGHYAEESMKKTVVPNRNMVLLSLATALAVSRKADHVAYAAHAGDHAIYPDCRKEFADRLGEAIKLCDWTPPTLLRPFVEFSKAGICARGAALGVPFQMTYSCYKGKARHCGKCGTCVERREAFQLAGVPDPTEYQE